MLVRELKAVLKDPNMQERNLNVKFTNTNLGGNPRLTIYEVLNQMNQRFEQVMTAITALSNRVDCLETNLNSRLDNLVVKNNLKE